MMTPDTIVRRWFEQVWNQQDEGAIDQLMSPEALSHDLPTAGGPPTRGPAGFKPFHQRILAAFPDIRIDVVRTITEGEFVAVHCRVSVTHSGDALGIAATGRPAAFSGIAIARVNDGQIVEAWNCFDFLSLYQQLGMVAAI
jgi:steroid delta-isomerase-like uncharacterized protein